MSEQPVLFTVGHSNHSEEHFVNLLEQHAIQVLADVRTQPFSRYTPHFNRESLQDTLRVKRIKYLFMGDQLGGRPSGEQFYDAEGHVLYAELAKAPLFLQGLGRLQRGIERFRVKIGRAHV